MSKQSSSKSTNKHNIHAKYKEGGKLYSGAGVLVVEDYFTKAGKIEQCIVLVRNGKSGFYTDFGGSYEKSHVNLKETAHHELREESRNLFNISEKYFKKYVDIPVGSGTEFFRSYIIKINGISRKYFAYNKKLIDTFHSLGKNVPYMWRETDNIVHIPFNNIDFNLLGARGQILLTDIDGNRIKLHGRAKRLIYYSQATIHNVIRDKPIAKKKRYQKTQIKQLDQRNLHLSFIIKLKEKLFKYLRMY